jgi:O-antigen/teichoic acid export membrane protein
LIKSLINIRKKPFVRNVIAVASGTAMAQLISLTFAPLITRIYGPEDFGLNGVFIASTSVVSSIAALTYPLAIVLAKSDADAKGFIRLSLYIASIVALLITLAFIFFKNEILKLAQIEAIEQFVFLIPLAVFFSVVFEVTQQWSIRVKQFKIRAKVAVFQALIINLAKMGAGLYYPLAAVLILLTSISSAFQAALLSAALRRSKKEANEKIFEPKTIKQLALEHKDFPLYRTPQVFINSVSQSMPVLLLASFFGPTTAGFYSIGVTVLGIPSQLIGKSVGDVFYPRIVDAANNGENITKLIKKATLALAATGLIPFSIIIGFGPWLFGIFFGADWTTAGEYARWQAIWLYFAFLNRPSVAAIPVLGLQGFFLIYELVSVATRAGALAIGFNIFNSDLYSVKFYSIAGVVLNIFLILLTLRKSKALTDRQSKKREQ